MNEPSLKKNFALSTLYQILFFIAPFITAPYVSRVLTADGIGIYSFTNSIQMYFSMFAALGTVSYGTREIARTRNDKKKRSILFWEIELLTIITSCACLSIYGVFLVLTKNYKIYFLILGMNIVAVMLDISWFFTGIEQLKYTVGPNAAFKILGVVAVFLFVKTKNNLTMYIFIMSMVTLLSNLTMWAYLPKFIYRVSADELKIRKHFRETLVYFIPTIATSIYTILDKTLIGLITAETNENGYYEQATKIVNMAKSLTFVSLNTILGARISFLFAEEKHDEIKKRIEKSIDYILFMGIGICLGIVGVAPRFVPAFFGKGYSPVIQLLYLFSPIIIIIGISNCLGSQYYNPVGLRALSAKFIITGSVVNLILNVILIPMMKSKGAVFATLAAETVITVLYLRFCNGFLNYKAILQYGWKKLIAGVIMFIGIRSIDRNIANNIYASIIEIVFGLFIYIISLWLLQDSFWKYGIQLVKGSIQRGSNHE